MSVVYHREWSVGVTAAVIMFDTGSPHWRCNVRKVKTFFHAVFTGLATGYTLCPFQSVGVRFINERF